MDESTIENAILDWANTRKAVTLAFKPFDQSAYRNGSYQAAKKGQIKGISDLIMLVEGHTIYVEVKTPVGVQSEYQERFEEKVKESGQHYWLVRSLKEFKKLMEERGWEN